MSGKSSKKKMSGENKSWLNNNQMWGFELGEGDKTWKLVWAWRKNKRKLEELEQRRD